MKGTSPLNNNEIRFVSACFDGVFQARHRGLYFLLIIVGVFIGCGRDTDTANTGAAVFVEVKPPRVRGAEDPYAWHADFDVVFSGAPIDMEVEFDLKAVDKSGFKSNWEQTGNIVTLQFEFKLLSIEYREGPTEEPIETWILECEEQQRSVEVALTWADGRKTFTVEAYPPKSLFVGRTDILSFEK